MEELPDGMYITELETGYKDCGIEEGRAKVLASIAAQLLSKCRSIASILDSLEDDMRLNKREKEWLLFKIGCYVGENAVNRGGVQ